MNPYYIAAGAVGGVFILDTTGAFARDGVTEAQSAGKAIAAAMNNLRERGAIAGVSYQVAPSNDAVATLINLRKAMVAKYGPIDNSGSPKSLITPLVAASELVEVMTAWLHAYNAGRATSPDFALASNVLNYASPCSSVASEDRTAIGEAACNLSSYRDQVSAMDNPKGVDALTVQTFSLVNALAAEMDGADFTTPGVRKTETAPQFSDIPGALAAAGAATAGFVAGVAGDAAGAIAGAIVGSPLFWAVGLGIVGYMVLR